MYMCCISRNDGCKTTYSIRSFLLCSLCEFTHGLGARQSLSVCLWRTSFLPSFFPPHIVDTKLATHVYYGRNGPTVRHFFLLASIRCTYRFLAWHERGCHTQLSLLLHLGGGGCHFTAVFLKVKVNH
jgi:hypothetical protein